MKVSLLSTVMFVLVSPMMAETPNGIVYKVRLANGASQFYQIVVSSSIPPAKAAKWATPSVAQNKLSAQGAGIVAVGWAGGWTTRAKGGPTNSMTNIGGNTPGGFYNASNVRIDSVQLQNDPVPYYLVRLTGQIGETRQTLYGAVLEDGRIIRPTPVSGASQAIRTVALSKSGQGVGEQKQTALKVRKSHRQHVPAAKKDS
jgi:hypothetical protein